MSQRQQLRLVFSNGMTISSPPRRTSPANSGESAKSTDRTEFLKLLAYCREQKGRLHAVIVYALTRFSRQQSDHHAIATLLRGLGISLRSATEPIDDSPSGRLMEGILAAMAQHDNDVKAARTVVGMKAAVERGRWVWRAPLGYRNGRRGDVSLEPDPEMGPLVADAFTLCASGIRGRALIQQLTARGLRTRLGHPLTPTTLYSMLRNRAYVGYVQSKAWGSEVKGDFVALVDEETFGLVQRRIAEAPTATRAVERHRNHDGFPLRRFATCAVCARPLTGSTSKGRSRAYAFYHCPRGCTRVSTAALEAAFLDLLTRLRPNPERWALFTGVVLDLWEQATQRGAGERAEIQRQVTALEKQSHRLDEAFLYDRSVDEQTYHTQRDRLRERLTIAQLDLNDAAERVRSIHADLAFAKTLQEGAAQLWTDEVSVERRIAMQWAMFPQGMIVSRGSKSQKGSPEFEPQIRALSCLEFFHLPDVSSRTSSMASLTSGSWNQVTAWLGHVRRTRVLLEAA